MSYKWCFVPLCTNTTFTAPNKIFVSVPKDKSRRKRWLKAAKRDEIKKQLAAHTFGFKNKPKDHISTMYCCEDHFKMEDVENWVHFQLMGGIIKMKSEIVPHIFDCQPNRTAAHTTKLMPRRAAQKRNIQRIFDSVAIECPSGEIVLPVDLLPTSQHNDVPNYQELHTAPIAVAENVGSPMEEPEPIMYKDKSTQARIRTTYRSKGTSCDLGATYRDTPPTVSTACSPIQPGINIQTLPMKTFFKQAPVMNAGLQEKASDDLSESQGSAGFTLSATCTDSSDADSDYENVANDELRMLSLKRTLLMLEKYPRQYLGLPDDCFYLVDLLAQNLKARKARENVLLTLKKLRLNEPFVTLGHDFGISCSQASRIFKNTLPKLAQCMKQLVVWSTKETIQKMLPISFRTRFNNVQSIIDCFEIEIEKPTDPVKQALTWSEYKKTNTIKYFVSSTPDGIVNFISTGYGGRTSDIIITEQCGYLEKLTPGIEVMADRGFKHIETQLLKKGCTLIRPPSVSADKKCTHNEVMETKVIASLRIHIERVIRRFREFAFLAPHACIDVHSIYLADNAVVVAAGIVNLQGPLIK